MRTCTFLCVLVFLLEVSSAFGHYIRPDLETIPVARLTKNLEEKRRQDPDNVQVHLNLARAYAMAFAKKSDDIKIRRGKIDDGVWFGFEPAFVPFGKPVPAHDPEQDKLAQSNLKQAIDSYRMALKLQSKNLTAQLGLAWCLEQSGTKAEAITAYRQVVVNGWATNKSAQVAPLGGHFITSEAAGYLIPLLDPVKDKQEIELLQQRVAMLSKLPRPITPIAIPLRDGLTASDILDSRAQVAFDADGTGRQAKWSWITRDAAWLVMDHSRNGKITSALQMFGSVTFWMFWDNGYQALSSLDDNHDGELSSSELNGLALWHDINGNGISEPGEVRSLSSYGIVGLTCRADAGGNTPYAAAQSLSGVRFANGSIRPSFDLILNRR